MSHCYQTLIISGNGGMGEWGCICACRASLHPCIYCPAVATNHAARGNTIQDAVKPTHHNTLKDSQVLLPVLVVLFEVHNRNCNRHKKIDGRGKQRVTFPIP